MVSNLDHRGKWGLRYSTAMKALLLVMLSLPAVAQVSITLQRADHAVLPGASRRLYADVEGTQNVAVEWKVSGGCTLASSRTEASPQVVTAPAKGSKCGYTMKAPTNMMPSFTSAASCTVTASAAADETKTASIVIPVCAEEPSMSTFPSNLVLFKGQPGVVQSNLRGSANTAVTWSVTLNPGNGGSLLGGSTNRHAVFIAKTPGTYVLTAASVVDSLQKASSTIQVTSQEMPVANTDHTETTNCTAVGKGKTYEVGPTKPLRDLNAVQWNLLRGGDTVRIHNEDTTGNAPTTYHQHIALIGSGTADQPIRICGVPDARGNKPILDGADATSRRDEDWASGYIENLAIIALHDPVHKWGGALQQNRNVVIEGLHLRNANPDYKFHRQIDNVLTAYDASAACVNVATGIDILVRGNELENCSQGVFSNARTPGGNMVYNLTIEGNSIHGWGVEGNIFVHGMYLQAIGLQVQFNYFGAPAPGASSNIIKTRSVLQFLRWNYMSQSATTGRAFDMVEPQAFVCYVVPMDFSLPYHGAAYNNDCYPPRLGVATDPLTADNVAANYEAYQADYVYGNILDDAGSHADFVHYGFDQSNPDGPGNNRRAGTLFFWANTLLLRARGGQKTIFDPVAPDTEMHSYQFPRIESVNNVFGATGGASYRWVAAFWPEITVDSNWMQGTAALPNDTSQDTYQGGTPQAQRASCNVFGHCKPGNGHLRWQRGGREGSMAETLYTGPLPFDALTFVPGSMLSGLAAPLPQGIRDQPSNMEYQPATNRIVFRSEQMTLGALN